MSFKLGKRRLGVCTGQNVHKLSTEVVAWGGKKICFAGYAKLLFRRFYPPCDLCTRVLSELPNLGRPDIRRAQQERQTSVRRTIEERPKNMRTDAWNDMVSLPFQCCNLNHWEAGEKPHLSLMKLYAA